METLIELYVNEQFDNLAAALTFHPKRVVFLSSGFMPERCAREGITRFIKANCCEGENAEVRFIDIGNRSLGSLLKRIGEVVRTYDDCVIDMTGGPTGALIAAQRYCSRHKARALFYDSRRERYVNIYGMSKELEGLKLPELTVSGLIGMGGGLVTGNGHSVAQYASNRDIADRVLEIYAKNLSHWNAFSEYLQFACKSYYDSRTQLFMAPSTLLNNSILLFANKRLLKLLFEAGALLELATDGESISFRFKNGFIKELLTTVGECLELLIYSTALESGRFGDVEMSVVFDWDGIFHGNFNDTTNELDVVMTRKLSSVFVSCKSARPDTRDLYEIDYLAHRFGGRDAEVVLATATNLSTEAWSIYMRARDMGVIVIERRDIEKGREHILKMLLEPSWLDDKPEKQ